MINKEYDKRVEELAVQFRNGDISYTEFWDMVRRLELKLLCSLGLTDYEDEYTRK